MFYSSELKVSLNKQGYLHHNRRVRCDVQVEMTLGITFLGFFSEADGKEMEDEKIPFNLELTCSEDEADKIFFQDESNF